MFNPETKSAQYFFDGIRSGDRVLIAQAITLLESTVQSHRDLGLEILQLCLPHAGQSIRIGITGAPGVGKSSMIEKLGLYIVTQKRHLAVLAVDPSSKKTKGSILGDKTRMQELAKLHEVFIRPTASGEHLGGVAAATRETILLLEAAGYDTILVETVGVGQSETAVFGITDIFILLLIAGAGDELQGIKRGIMEMADIILMNKADGENLQRTQIAMGEVTRALHLFQEKESLWPTEIMSGSALTGSGVPELWQAILDYQKHTGKNGYFTSNRNRQNTQWFNEYLHQSLLNRFMQSDNYRQLLLHYTHQVEQAAILPPIAVQALLKEAFTQ